jgi:hypothetical protein
VPLLHGLYSGAFDQRSEKAAPLCYRELTVNCDAVFVDVAAF